MTIIISTITTPIAKYSKISSKLKNGESSLVDVSATFAERLLEESGISVEAVLRGSRGGDSKVVVREPNSDVVVIEFCGCSKGVVGTS